MNFEPSIEEDFRRDYTNKTISSVRVGLLLGALLFALFGILDIWLLPSTLPIALFIRFGIIIPILLLSFWFTYTTPYKRIVQLTISTATVLSGLSVIGLITTATSKDLGFDFYYCGIILVLFFNYTFIHLRFPYAFTVGLIITFSYLVTIINLQGIFNLNFNNKSVIVFLNNSFFLIASNFIGAIVAYKNEKMHRNDYIQRRKIEANNKELIQANSTKDKFFSIIGHDLKGPIQSIINFNELIIRKQENFSKEKIINNIDLANQSLKHVSELLVNLLSWANAQNGKMEYKPEEFSLHTLTSEIIHLYSNNNKDISFINQVPQDINLTADRNMIQTIIRNFISNAIKYSNHGGMIKITAHKTETHTNISVIDNGIGMNTSTLNKLFSPNITSMSGTNNEKGTGLGLLLCKEFCLKHDGSIKVQSEENKGSTFTFSIPNNLN